MREGSTDRETVEPLAPERIWAAPSPHGGWAEAHAGDWPSPANPHDTKFVRHDLYDAAVARAEAAEAALPSVSAKAAEYHAIANAYAMWVSDVCELLEERIGEWDLDDPADAKLKDLMDRAELGIAKETRAALGEGD